MKTTGGCTSRRSLKRYRPALVIRGIRRRSLKRYRPADAIRGPHRHSLRRYCPVRAPGTAIIQPPAHIRAHEDPTMNTINTKHTITNITPCRKASTPEHQHNTGVPRQRTRGTGTLGIAAARGTIMIQTINQTSIQDALNTRHLTVHSSTLHILRRQHLTTQTLQQTYMKQVR